MGRALTICSRTFDHRSKRERKVIGAIIDDFSDFAEYLVVALLEATLRLSTRTIRRSPNSERDRLSRILCLPLRHGASERLDELFEQEGSPCQQTEIADT